MQQYLITAEEVSKLSRDMSIHLDDYKIETYIRESENIDIKSALGDALFLEVNMIFFLMVGNMIASAASDGPLLGLKQHLLIILMPVL